MKTVRPPGAIGDHFHKVIEHAANHVERPGLGAVDVWSVLLGNFWLNREGPFPQPTVVRTHISSVAERMYPALENVVLEIELFRNLLPYVSFKEFVHA